MPESYNICLDVGGTKVLGAIFNEKDEIIYRLKKRSKSQGEGSADVEKVIISVVEEMIQASGIDRKKLNAIASCAPGVIDQDKGIVLFTPNLPWRDYDIAGAMRKRFGVPFFVGNDVNLGVYGEYKFGAGRGYRNIVGFFPGTGMGGGLILNGELFTGNQFKAAEYGHMILDPEGPLCGCGQRGCLEAFSSKKGMTDYIRQQIARGRECMLADDVLNHSVFRSKKLKRAVAAHRGHGRLLFGAHPRGGGPLLHAGHPPHGGAEESRAGRRLHPLRRPGAHQRTLISRRKKQHLRCCFFALFISPPGASYR